MKRVDNFVLFLGVAIFVCGLCVGLVILALAALVIPPRFSGWMDDAANQARDAMNLL